MVVALQPRHAEPVLRYRLDPGEPGIRTAAPAGQSAYLVVSQEVRNLTRLRSAAIARGEAVVDASVTFAPGIDGGIATVRAGQTTVRSVERNPTRLAPTADLPATQPEAPQPRAPAGVEGQQAQTFQVLALRRNEADLLAAAGRLQIQLQATRSEEFRAQDADQRAGVARSRRELETSQAQLRQEINRVRVEQITQAISDVFQLVDATINGNLQLPLALVRAGRRAAPPPAQ